MAIDMPLVRRFTSAKFGLQTNSQTFVSPLTKNTQRALLGGALWVATYSTPKMSKQQAAEWKAFFLQLDGMVNTFNAYDPDVMAPAGVGTGTPLVNGASQTGNTLIIDGCTANTLGWLVPGDRFNVNGELKEIVTRADTNGSGQVTLSFRPALRASPADNAPISLTKPTCTMILSDDQQAIWECDMNGFYEPKTFTATEVFA